MSADILRTTITPDGADDLVQLEIGDVLPLVEGQSMGGSIRLTLEARTRGYMDPTIGLVQLETLNVALETLRRITQRLRTETQEGGHGTPPHRQ